MVVGWVRVKIPAPGPPTLVSMHWNPSASSNCFTTATVSGVTSKKVSLEGGQYMSITRKRRKDVTRCDGERGLERTGRELMSTTSTKRRKTFVPSPL